MTKRALNAFMLWAGLATGAQAQSHLAGAAWQGSLLLVSVVSQVGKDSSQTHSVSATVALPDSTRPATFAKNGFHPAGADQYDPDKLRDNRASRHEDPKKLVHPFAIASFVLLLAGPFMVWAYGFGLLLLVGAIVFGGKALNRIRKNPDAYRGKALARIGLIGGVILLAFFTIVLIAFITNPPSFGL